MAKYAVQIMLDGENERRELVTDTLDALPEKVRPVIAMLDAMELEKSPGHIFLIASCKYGNKMVYIGFTPPHTAYYSIWGHP